MRTIRVSLGVAAAVTLCVTVADAQQPTRRAGSRTIEIRGQVPTPQVVTVRPREAPQFDRNVLVPGFYNPDFPSLATWAYQLVPRRAITGRQADTAALAAPQRTPPAGGGTSPPAPLPPPPAAAPAPPA